MSTMTLFFISALLHGYVGWRLLPDLAGLAGAQAALAAVLLASALLTPWGLLARLCARGVFPRR